MTRVLRFLLLGTVVFASCLIGEPRAYAAVSITIDATDLTPVSLTVRDNTAATVGTFSSGTAATLSLDTGAAHDIITPGGLIDFVVTAGGTVDYSTSLDTFLSGRGTTTLTINGFDVFFDGTALSKDTLIIQGVATFPPSPVLALSLPAGSNYGFLGGGPSRGFEITNSGEFDFAASLDDIFTGRGTDTLTISGYTVSVDATALSVDVIQVLGVEVFATAAPANLNLLPGPAYEILGGGGPREFSVESDGTIDFAASHDSYFSGRGTTTLVIDGVAVNVDVRALDPQVVQIPGTQILSTTTIETITLIPDSSVRLLGAGDDQLFPVGLDGLFTGLPATYAGLPVSGAGTSTLTVGDTNDPPTADAGPDQAIHAGQTVDLDGSGSFDDQTASAALDYEWTFMSRPLGSSSVLTDATTATPSFVADLPGTYVVKLIVTDEEGEASVPDTVSVSSLNGAPTADAGVDQVVGIGELATLDGGASSDPDGDSLTFAWVLTAAPVGSVAALVDGTTATPTLTPDLEGTYEVSLVVNDGFASSPADVVQIVGVGPVFAQQQLGEACDFVSALPDASFDAKGHRKSMCNDYAKIIKFIQKGKTSQAIAHLGPAIERVDGCTLRGTPDPKGAGQPHAADYLVICAEQEVVYELLAAALDAID